AGAVSGPGPAERLHRLAAHRVGARHHGRLDHRRVLEERALHLEGADAVAGRDDDVVGAPDEPEVAVLVTAGAIAGEIPLAAPARRRLLRALPVFAEERRRVAPQRELAHLAGRQLLPVLADHAQVVAREGLPHRARADREAGHVRGEAARLGLAGAGVDPA